MKIVLITYSNEFDFIRILVSSLCYK